MKNNRYHDIAVGQIGYAIVLVVIFIYIGIRALLGY